MATYIHIGLNRANKFWALFYNKGVRAKTFIDFALALVAALLLLPLLIVLAVAVWVSMGRPVLFRQTRAGKHGLPFDMYKFRTMTNTTDATGKLLPDADRITPVGSFLRRTSLDELPELLNVLRGEMSLVGPRPLLMRYVPRYTKGQARRLEVKPGVTGLAQVMGRNSLSWDEKFAYDVDYVDTRSLAKDLWILWRTVVVVLKRDGISQEGEATMQEFMGKDAQNRD